MTKVVLVYNIDEIIVKEEELKEFIKDKQKILLENEMDLKNSLVKDVDKEIEKLEEKIHSIEHNLQKDYKKFAGIAFISFQTEEMKE